MDERDKVDAGQSESRKGTADGAHGPLAQGDGLNLSRSDDQRFESQGGIGHCFGLPLLLGIPRSDQS